MGLERKVRFGGRSVLMGNGTKGAVYEEEEEDMIDAGYNSAMDDDWVTGVTGKTLLEQENMKP